MKIDGSAAIVTGASSGIGDATARLLASRGARVVLAARRAARIEALAAELPGAIAVPTDVTDKDQLAHLVERCLEAHGRVDILVNNAGQGLHVPLLDLRPDDLRAVLELNVIAPLTAMQLVLPSMRAQGGGAIVNVSSATSLRLFPGLSGYAATKAALNLLSQIGRMELASAGVAVSVVYPSVTATEFHQSLRAGQFAGGARRFPADPPELVATTIAFAIETGEAHLMVEDPPRGGPAPRPRSGQRRPVGGGACPPDAGRPRVGGWRGPANGAPGPGGGAVILVTAAAGRTGRSLIPALVRRGHAVRALDVDPGVDRLRDLGAAETIAGDMLDPGDVDRAVDGVEAVVHIGPPMHPREAEMGHAVVTAARRAGVSHLVQFSVTHPQLEPLLNHQSKLAVERMVLLSRIPFTILQPMHYMQNIDVRRVVERGALTQPFALDTPLQHVDLEDVTEVAALVVTDPQHHYATYELCGSDYLNARQLAAVIQSVSGRPVAPEQVPVAHAFSVGAPSGAVGTPPSEEDDWRRDAMVRLFDHYGRHGITGNPNVLSWLLGRPPTTFREYVRRSLG